jgi:hypothetical protein
LYLSTIKKILSDAAYITERRLRPMPRQEVLYRQFPLGAPLGPSREAGALRFHPQARFVRLALLDAMANPYADQPHNTHDRGNRAKPQRKHNVHHTLRAH